MHVLVADAEVDDFERPDQRRVGIDADRTVRAGERHFGALLSRGYGREALESRWWWTIFEALADQVSTLL